VSGHVIHTLDKLAGPSGRGWSVAEQAQQQAQAGWKVTVLGTEIDPDMTALAPGVRWVVHPQLRPHRDPSQLQAYAAWLQDQLKELEPGVLNVHEGADLLAASLLQVKPLVYSAHSQPSYSLAHMPQKQVALALGALDGLLTFGHQAARALAQITELPANQGVLYPTFDSLQLPTRPASWQGSPQLVCVGRLDANKNQQLAVRALSELQAKLPGVQLALIGAPHLQDQLLDLARQLRVDDRLQMLGHRQDVHHLLAGADVLVMPSYTEGGPRSALESMLLGVPVAGSLALSEILGGGGHGELFEADDVSGCAAATVRALGRSEHQLRQAQEWARQIGDPQRNLQVSLKVLKAALDCH
jgi:glycosyltransferase involved in cell wall biosynthesis